MDSVDVMETICSPNN